MSCLVLSCICVVPEEDARGVCLRRVLGAAAVTRGWYREGPAGLKHGEERGEGEKMVSCFRRETRDDLGDWRVRRTEPRFGLC